MLNLYRLYYHLDALYSTHGSTAYSKERFILKTITAPITLKAVENVNIADELEGKSFDVWIIDLCKKLLRECDNDNIRYIVSDILGQREQYYKAIEALERNLKLNNFKNHSEYIIKLVTYYNQAFEKYRDIELHKQGLKTWYKCYKLSAKIDLSLFKEVCIAGTFLFSVIGKKKIAHKIYKKLINKNIVLNNRELTNFSFCCWENRDWENFHKYHFCRTLTPDYDYFGLKYSGKPMWTGKEDISNKTLLVQFEQGLGDNILMFGYFGRLAKLAKKVIFMCEPELAPLLKNNEWGIRIVPYDHLRYNKLRFDYWIESMSIPNVLNLDTKTMKVDGGYIKANPKLVEKYRKKYFNNNNIKIGVAYRGHVKGQLSRQVNTEQLLGLDNVENISIYFLDMSISDACGNKFKNNKPINIVKDTAKNFADTAAIIENCDLILATDNGLLNLAGAMGKKALGLFNTDYHFRWYDLNNKDCGYFNSVKPFVNKELDNWEDSIKQAIEEVKDYVSHKLQLD